MARVRNLHIMFAAVVMATLSCRQRISFRDILAHPKRRKLNNYRHSHETCKAFSSCSLHRRHTAVAETNCVALACISHPSVERKKKTSPLTPGALSVETIANCGIEYAQNYSDGSSTGGTGNGGHGINILSPDCTTARICSPVGERTCSFDCELKTVTECSQIVIRKLRGGTAQPGVLIFTDCRALVQPLGKSVREDLGKAVLLADYLRERRGSIPLFNSIQMIIPFCRS
ncbi:hypothetical protein PoB_000084100 [Plakobranchus ocellatus]|uniref:Uncharacterized protein n=1 Tax=Plakobranchus ocellatus TaxID=259542 RepID=A0AAV3XWA0_9GAST|nr:hypothetical protein PoB_000084100 [Plakobranchus ocellatus]